VGVPVIAVVGPTASGKSGLALALAERLDGEIVNADAMQLYRGMDIGTAKLSLEERQGVAHHQLDVLEVREEAMFARLVQADPVAAQAIQPNNDRRVVRALEVVELTGRPFSASLPTREYELPTITIGLLIPRSELDGRIATRVRRMWDSGLLDEVRRLDAAGLRAGRTAAKALGYSQALAHLDGLLTAGQAVEDTITSTRRFARRQESWFRPDPRIHWLVYDDLRLIDRALDVIGSA